ncbi:hypothetical protein WA026_006846 [Henosepilachna vigintioctopunctata]|uniref:Uncharacterized protein n=1 Tax=Henosepilachna vigintioctopunctata TaxID=420089 RepID=A0AAW1UH41_9CUCU
MEKMLLELSDTLKNAECEHKFRVTRIIAFGANFGRILPLIPIFAGLSVLGGASVLAKTVIAAKNAKKQVPKEDERHNQAMELIDHGLYVSKPKAGYGRFLKTLKNY